MSYIDKGKVDALRVALTLPDVHDSDAVVATWGELRALLQEVTEEYRKDAERMREALRRIIVHTPHNEVAPNELLVGLLANINRIANAAIAAEGK